MMMSPSGTSQDTVAESERRCMTETLTGAGGRSEREREQRDTAAPLISLDIGSTSPSAPSKAKFLAPRIRNRCWSG